MHTTRILNIQVKNELYIYPFCYVFHGKIPNFATTITNNFSMNPERYNLRGVSASKEDVHAAIRNVDKGLYPKAFCKIIYLAAILTGAI